MTFTMMKVSIVTFEMIEFAIMVHFDDIYNNNLPRNAGDEIKLLVCDGFDPNTVPTNGR